MWNGSHTEKSKIMTNGTNNISAAICMKGWKLEEATSFTYLGVTFARMAPAQ